MTRAITGLRPAHELRSDGKELATETIGLQSLHARQAGFAAALLDPELPVPQGLVGLDGTLGARRFNIYRNNVVAGLTATLRDAFPAVFRIVGDEFFAAMARTYVARERPETPVMLDYGSEFPRFVGEFEPARQLSYLSDVARVEQAWVEAYHAPEAQALASTMLASLDPCDLSDVRVSLHPSLRVVRSRFPVFTIWRMNIEGGEPARVDLEASGEDVLLVRPLAEVEVRSLPPGGASFIEALASGLCMFDAMEAATAADGRFGLAINLAGLVESQAFVAMQLERP